MAVDANLTEGITLAGTVINTGITTVMTPPLVYLVAIGFAVIGIKVAWKFLRPHVR